MWKYHKINISCHSMVILLILILSRCQWLNDIPRLIESPESMICWPHFRLVYNLKHYVSHQLDGLIADTQIELLRETLNESKAFCFPLLVLFIYLAYTKYKQNMHCVTNVLGARIIYDIVVAFTFSYVSIILITISCPSISSCFV